MSFKKNETIFIAGMTDGHSINTVKDVLSGIEGVTVQNVEIGSAMITYDPTIVDRSRIVRTLEEAGYAVEPVQSRSTE